MPFWLFFLLVIFGGGAVLALPPAIWIGLDIPADDFAARAANIGRSWMFFAPIGAVVVFAVLMFLGLVSEANSID